MTCPTCHGIDFITRPVTVAEALERLPEMVKALQQCVDGCDTRTCPIRAAKALTLLTGEVIERKG